MPRQARLDVPGALHHIMVRGINKSNIFDDERDKTGFLERLGQNVVEGKNFVYAWVLMDNHVHILFKSGRDGISAMMRKQLTWYAQYYNRRHKRTGHVFENRYKSILCEEDHYLLALVRYIHLNPVRIKVIQTIAQLDDYPERPPGSNREGQASLGGQGGGRRRKVSRVRATIAKRGLDEAGLSMAEIARHVGVTTSSIAKAVSRLEQE